VKRADFERLLAELQEEELQINQSKGREYAQGDEDALRNFKLAALLLGEKPIVVTLDMRTAMGSWGLAFRKRHRV
jgi:hypothetical protein